MGLPIYLGETSLLRKCILEFDTRQPRTDQHKYQISSACGSVTLTKTTLPYLMGISKLINLPLGDWDTIPLLLTPLKMNRCARSTTLHRTQRRTAKGSKKVTIRLRPYPPAMCMIPILPNHTSQKPRHPNSIRSTPTISLHTNLR